MAKVNLEDIKKLREESEASVADCREALDEAEGNFKKAIELLREKSLKRAEKKSDREVKAGSIFSYIHHNGRVGAMVSVACETDFVAKTDDFQKLGKEIALHLAASRPETVEELLDQDYVRDPSKNIQGLIKEVIGKLGENIQVVDFKVLSI
jgi:elongation factor Ts